MMIPAPLKFRDCVVSVVLCNELVSFLDFKKYMHMHSNSILRDFYQNVEIHGSGLRKNSTPSVFVFYDIDLISNMA